MMKASLALAERRPDDLKAAMEKLGQEAPSSRQLLLLRLMGLVAPPSSAGCWPLRGILILLVAVIVLLAIGFGIVELVALPFGGIGTAAPYSRPARRHRPSACSCSWDAEAGQGSRRARRRLTTGADAC